MEKYVTCKICNTELKRITKTHLKKHYIDTDQYKQLFPKALIVSEETAWKLGKAARENNVMHYEENKIKVSNALKGISKSKAHRDNLSKARTGVSWGKHTEEHKERMSQKMKGDIANGKFVMPSFKGCNHTEENKRKKSISSKKQWNELGYRENFINKRKGYTVNISDEDRNNRSIRATNRLLNNELPNQNSSLEIKLKQFLCEVEIEYIHQYPLSTRKGLFVFDFYLPELNLLVETDGEYWHSSLKTITKDKIKEKLARELNYEFLRISNVVWKPELIFASIKDQIKNNQAIIQNRLDIINSISKI